VKVLLFLVISFNPDKKLEGAIEDRGPLD
jgi:hypothetical protein